MFDYIVVDKRFLPSLFFPYLFRKFVAVYAIHAGQYFRDDPTPFLQIHSLELFIPHPRFDFVSLVYDIAVAKLNVSLVCDGL